jgi:hypothetical protein
MIPKIIHQTWKDKNLPDILKNILDANKNTLHNYEFRLWSDNEIIELIKTEYPYLLKVYQSTRTGVQKGDIARIILLHRFGGIYVDLDILILRDPIECLHLSEDKLYITYEPSAQTMHLYNKDDYLCNAFFAANAGNNMLNFALQNMGGLFQRNGASIFMQFDIFGGSYLKSIIESYINYQRDVCIIDNRDLVFPINDLKFTNLSSSQSDWQMIKDASYHPNTSMVHYWIHGDFESKKLLTEYQCDKTMDIHKNVFEFFCSLYPNNARQLC